MEQPPNPEELREAIIIAELESTTPEELMGMMSASMSEKEKIIPRDAEKIKEYISWEREREAFIESIPEGIEKEVERLQHEIKRAQLFKKGGMNAMAREIFQNARDAAWGLGLQEEADYIEQELESLE